jgi:tripartite-type tricarboxylate transporter receptor subunit TctC
MTYGINQAITATLYKKLPYHHVRDFTPISLYATMPNILCVTPSLPAADVSEFVKFMKASPGKYKFASSGVGASPHLTMEYFMARTGLNLIHVPYKNSSQGYTDTMSGEVQAFFFNLPGPLTHVRAGRLRALAVTSGEAGSARCRTCPPSWNRAFPISRSPSGKAMRCPEAHLNRFVAKIHAAMMKALALPELEKRFFDAGVSPAPQTPAEFVKFVNAETAKWQKVVTEAKVTIE